MDDGDTTEPVSEVPCGLGIGDVVVVPIGGHRTIVDAAPRSGPPRSAHASAMDPRPVS